MKVPNGSQLGIWLMPFNQRKSQTAGLEKMILDDGVYLYTEKCLICGSKLNTVTEVYHKACNNCWSRR